MYYSPPALTVKCLIQNGQVSKSCLPECPKPDLCRAASSVPRDGDRVIWKFVIGREMIAVQGTNFGEILA